MVRKYRIGFFKKLADSTGHEVDACQGQLEISAPNRQQAIEEACRRFAGERHLSGWQLRADRITACLAKQDASAASQEAGKPRAIHRTQHRHSPFTRMQPG